MDMELYNNDVTINAELQESDETLNYKLDEIFGTAVERLEQTVKSEKNGGMNVWTCYLTNGTSYNLEVLNGASIDMQIDQIEDVINDNVSPIPVEQVNLLFDSM